MKKMVALYMLVMMLVATTCFAETVKYTGMVYGQSVIANNAFTFPMGRAKCTVTDGRMSGKVEFDLANVRTVQAWGAYTVGANTLTVGTLFVPSGNDFPAPNNALFCWNPLFAVQPGLFDRGAVLSHTGVINASVGAINGTGLKANETNRLALDGNVNATHGSLYGSVNVRSSANLRYGWAVAEYRWPAATLRAHGMRKQDLRTHTDDQLGLLDLEVKVDQWRIGVSGGKSGYLEADLEYTLQGATRIVATGIREAYGSQPQVKVMVQHGVSFHN